MHISQEEVGCMPVPNWLHDLKRSIAEAQVNWRDYQDEAEELVRRTTHAVDSMITGTFVEFTLLVESADIEKRLMANPSPYTSK